MLDPFPPPPLFLSTAITPLAKFFNLPTLPLHIHEVLLSFLFYTFTHLYLAPFLSQTFIPKIYNSFNTRTRINWNVHIVSFVQSCVVCVTSLWVLYHDDERAALSWQGRVWGYTGATGLIQALALGYFLWDLWMCARYVDIFGKGMLAHGISAVVVFSLGFRPFVNFYAPTFILYELSSPFLNIHWALDKLSLTGSIYQLINGIFLISTFFSCRLAWGSYQSYRVFFDVYAALRSPNAQIVLAAPHTEPPATTPSQDRWEEIMRFSGDEVVPLWLAGAYLGSNVVLNGLNWWWFTKMIETIRKRFEPGAKERGGRKEEGVVVANGDAKGVVSGAIGSDGGKARKRKV